MASIDTYMLLLENIAIAIREKLQEEDTYLLSEMPDKIREIDGGGSDGDPIIIVDDPNGKMVPSNVIRVVNDGGLSEIVILPEPIIYSVTGSSVNYEDIRKQVIA